MEALRNWGWRHTRLEGTRRLASRLSVSKNQRTKGSETGHEDTNDGRFLASLHPGGSYSCTTARHDRISGGKRNEGPKSATGRTGGVGMGGRSLTTSKGANGGGVIRGREAVCLFTRSAIQLLRSESIYPAASTFCRATLHLRFFSGSSCSLTDRTLHVFHGHPDFPLCPILSFVSMISFVSFLFR